MFALRGAKMPAFEIVEIDDKNKTRPFPVGVFHDGKTAQSVVEGLKLKHPGRKFQPRPIKDTTNDWKEREQSRLDSGHYQVIDWKTLGIKPIKDHFAHRSGKTEANIAFIANDADGQADRQRSIHIRAYLKEYYPKLTVEENRKVIWEYCGEDVTDGLNFAYTPEEIEHVYTHGPSSCMSAGASAYGGGVHPTRAYSGPDLAVAYFQTDTGRITARAVCFPARKLYTFPYGDGTKLIAALEEHGYSEDDGSGYEGARLTKIPASYEDDDGDYVEDGWVCPFIDNYSTVHVTDDYLVIGYKSGGENYDCQNTSGVVG